MSKRNTKKYHALLPRKPTTTFIDVFQLHCFNDNLRANNHPNKGISCGHYELIDN